MPPAARRRCAWTPGISTRLNDFRQDFRRHAVCAAVAAARRRPVRWDSDHVVLLDDETQALPVRLFVTICSTGCISASTSRCLYQPHCRVGHWYTQYEKTLLRALLEPTAELRKLESAGITLRVWRYWKSRNRCRGRR